MAVIFLDGPETEHLRGFGRTLETGCNVAHALEKVLLTPPRINQQCSIFIFQIQLIPTD
jgi:hypothetical protein